MTQPPSNERLFLRCLILLGLILFGVFLLTMTGLLNLALSSDPSMISWLILAIYALATLHWLWRAWQLDQESARCAACSNNIHSLSTNTSGSSLVLGYMNMLVSGEASKESHKPLLDTFADDLANTHAPGHFASDLLLKLGLIGTVIGFILMLLPIGNISEFDPALMQQLLSAMSGGMAVALYTTLAGLVTSTLLKVQYYFLDAALTKLINDLSLLSHRVVQS